MESHPHPVIVSELKDDQLVERLKLLVGLLGNGLLKLSELGLLKLLLERLLEILELLLLLEE